VLAGAGWCWLVLAAVAAIAAGTPGTPACLLSVWGFGGGFL